MLKKIDLSQLQINPFTAIGKDWMLITAGKEKDYNTMTASWGGLGVLWNKNVAIAFIRPTRHTYSFAEKSDIFTLSFFGEEYRDALTFCGKNSGRDCDKAEETGLIPLSLDGGVTFSQAKTVLVLKKIYFDDINPDNFLADYIASNYHSDYHRMYIGEIISAYIAQ